VSRTTRPPRACNAASRSRSVSNARRCPWRAPHRCVEVAGPDEPQDARLGDEALDRVRWLDGREVEQGARAGAVSGRPS
jgi:hypothetical protein